MSGGLRVRTRLTLLYAALFLVGGSLLVTGMQWSMRDLLFADISARVPDLAALKQDGEGGVELAREQLRSRAEQGLAWNAAAGLAAVTLLSGAAGRDDVRAAAGQGAASDRCGPGGQ